MSKSKAIKKNWGYELQWAKTQDYQGKIIVFEKKDQSIPLHMHKNTEKTWFVNAGEFNAHWINTSSGELMQATLSEGSVFHVAELTPVSITAKKDNSSLTEISNGNTDEYLLLSKQ